MNWGRVAATALAALMLSGCSANSAPTSKPTQSASQSSSLQIKKITGDPEADRLIAILNASCTKGRADGLAVELSGKKGTIYSFPAVDALSFEQVWSMMTKKGNEWAFGGWADGDVVCNEAGFANRVVPKGTPANSEGVVFDYQLKKVDEDTYDWSVFRQSPEFSPVRLTLKDDLISAVEYKDNMASYAVAYGPFDDAVTESYREALVESGQQYLYLGQHIYGMTLFQAKAYCKKHGLTILVGAENGEMLYPSGPPEGRSDPKRMLVSIEGGEIVWVWTM